MPAVTIRRAVADDADAIGRVHVAAWQWAYAGLMPQQMLDSLDPAARATMWTAALAGTDTAPFVAVLDDEIVGFAHMSASRDSDALATTGEVTSIYLEEHALGTGTGAGLWHTAIDWLRTKGYEEVTVWVLDTNTRGRAFYEHMGLTPDGATKTDERRSVPLNEVRYRGPITSSLPAAITTVLCDVDGVIRHWDSMTPIEHTHGLMIGSLRAAAFHPDLVNPAIMGAHSDEQWRANIVERLALTADRASAERAVAEWSGPSGTLDADVVAWLDRARASGRRVILVTNATSRLDADLARIGLHDHVDAVVNSSAIGFAKPDPRFYEAALATADVGASACVFIDDQAENVRAARSAGITAIRFRDVGSLPQISG